MHLVRFLPLFVLLCSGMAAPAMARAPQAHSTPLAATGQSDFQQAFQTMLADPASSEKTLRYARLAVAKGDYESAIPPLERLLAQNPRLSDVRLEVGVLYYLLNSHDVARGYLRDVTTDPGASPAQIARAHSYLTRL